ncbi:MAG: HAMP domain-containing histidine kinase [Rhodobiaceae bacterium]|nr:HAMP domain-containing histidine kinase [Rhodobiaceae bacterium]
MIAKLYRTTAFKLSLIYLLVFAAFAGFMIFYFAHNTGEILSRQHVTAMEDEARALMGVYRRGGIRRMAQLIDRLARRPNAGLYLVTDAAGEPLAGNISSVPPEILEKPGVYPVPYYRYHDDEEAEDDQGRTRPALVRSYVMDNGFRLVVGRDTAEADRFRSLVRRATLWSVGLMLVLALVSGFFISHRVLRRMEGVTDASRAIMGGDLSERIPVTGNGDEFDRLAISLNEMLGRIEALMAGLKEVSDNVAHDLKTPLTRMRNRVEGALRQDGSDPAAARDALETTLDECDGLIETFNALLSIARAEAGEGGEAERFDAAQMVRDLGELYEPVAEDAGIVLTVKAPESLTIEANRHLLGQALSNLIDNALKYAGGEEAAIMIGLEKTAAGVELSVGDNGPGIPDKDRERVTERFVRLDESRSEPGSGLGLSLVKAVAHRHGGELVLEDNGPGLKARLLLPASVLAGGAA